MPARRSIREYETPVDYHISLADECMQQAWGSDDPEAQLGTVAFRELLVHMADAHIKLADLEYRRAMNAKDPGP